MCILSDAPQTGSCTPSDLGSAPHFSRLTTNPVHRFFYPDAFDRYRSEGILPKCRSHSENQLGKSRLRPFHKFRKIEMIAGFDQISDELTIPVLR